MHVDQTNDREDEDQEQGGKVVNIIKGNASAAVQAHTIRGDIHIGR